MLLLDFTWQHLCLDVPLQELCILHSGLEFPASLPPCIFPGLNLLMQNLPYVSLYLGVLCQEFDSFYPEL